MKKCLVSKEVFRGIQNVNIEMLSKLPEQELRPILPCLVRMSLCSPLDVSSAWTAKRKIILKCLSGVEIVNNLVGLLSIDFHDLEIATKDQQSKFGANHKDNITLGQTNQGLALEFERSDAARKLRYLLTEMLSIISQIKEQKDGFFEKSSELFDSDIYLEEVSDVLCISQAELPHLLPMLDVTEALLHVSNGSWLLSRLVANNPECFLDVCSHLVMQGQRQDSESIDSQRRCEALTTLCDICPSHALTVRSMCIEHCKLPNLVLLLTLNHGKQNNNCDSFKEIIVFVSGILLEGDVSIRSWFSQYIRLCDKKKDFKSAIHIMREELINELNKIIQLNSDLFDENIIPKACSIFRLYSSLKCIAGLKFSEKENSTLLKLILKRPLVSESGIQFISLGISLLLACPHILMTEDDEKAVTIWLKWLLEISDDFENLCNAKSSFGEMLLLLAIHFHSNQNNAISELISAALGMKCLLKASTLSRLKLIFTTKVFTEQVVAAHAVKVPVTKNLSFNIKGFLPIHCIYQLLKSRTFSKHRVSIRDWVKSQMKQCEFPIHPIFPSLIEAYINSILLPNVKSDRSNEPISESNLVTIFQSEQFSLAVKLIHLYYTLLYQDVLMNNMKALQSSHRSFISYSSSFINSIPIKFLLQSAQSKSSQMAGMYSSLLGLVAVHHPHLCNVLDWLNCHNHFNFNTMVEGQAYDDHSLESLCSKDTFAKALSLLPSNYGQCTLMLEKLATYPAENLIEFKDIFVNNLLLFLEENTPRRCQDLILTIWNTLNSYFPDLKVLTANSLKSNNNEISMVKYKEHDLITDPLTVLRCDPRVFRCPPFMEILLTILNCFLQMSKTFLANHILSNPVTDGNKANNPSDREELRIALVATQESASLQILLECCLPLNDDEISNNRTLLSNQREIQCLICSHIHQKFISDPSLAKLVHFQGYPLQLIPIAVAGISSMHICLDFLPELIAQPQHTKQCFAIKLVSYLSLHYPVPKSLSVAKLCINVMKTLLSVLTSQKRPPFYVSTLPDLVRFCTAFPILMDDAVSFLIQLGSITKSELSTIQVESSELLVDGHLKYDEKEGILDEYLTFTDQINNTHLNNLTLYKCVIKTFDKIVGTTTLLREKLKT